MIKVYDTAEAFHFVDPPYINSDCGHYKGTFSDEDFKQLLEILANISGLFMLTMFPHSKLQEYIDKYKWNKHVVERCITASRDKRRKQIEWIITNY